MNEAKTASSESGSPETSVESSESHDSPAAPNVPPGGSGSEDAIRIRNWHVFQHFKDRRPPWIKLHREMLDQRDIMTLSAESFRFLVCLWLIASEDRDMLGTLPEISDIAYRLRISESKACELLKQVDTFLISNGYHVDAPETEKRQRREEAEDVEFSAFWKAYPRAVGKKDALKAWRKATDKPELAIVLASVERQKASEQWRKDGGKFIPYPATWLNKGHWSDKPLDIASKPATPHWRDLEAGKGAP